MGWTTPHTYTDGEVITHTLLNVDVRDNQLWIGSDHDHSGRPSGGNESLGSVDSIRFTNGADPGAGGTLAASGTLLKYHDGVQVVVLGGVAPAGTPSVRALGSANGTQAANGTHVHTLADAHQTASISGAVAETFSGFVAGVNNTPWTATATGSSQFIITHVFVPSSNNGTYLVLFNGTTLFTGSGGVVQHNSTAIILASGTYVGTTRNVGGTAANFVNVDVVGIGTPA